MLTPGIAAPTSIAKTSDRCGAVPVPHQIASGPGDGDPAGCLPAAIPRRDRLSGGPS